MHPFTQNGRGLTVLGLCLSVCCLLATGVALCVGMADEDRVWRMFDCIDADKSGEIDSTELMMHLLGLGQEHESVSELFKALDTDGDGRISREEFIAGFDKVATFQRL